jgi:branched-chain amino acid transport system substrate-binding protein
MAVALAAVLTVVGSACKSNDNGGGGGEKVGVTIYFQGAWTGPYSYLVTPGIKAAQLRVKELNADPNFPATITLKPADTQGGNDQTPQIAQTVASDTNTVAVIGPAFSGETRTVGDTYDQAGIPFVTGSATAVDLATNHWGHWYRTVGNDELQGGNDGKFIAQVIKAKKLFVSNDKGDYGEPLSLQVGKTAKQGGVEIVGTEGIAPTDNYASFLSDVKASGADTVFYGGYDADFAKIVTQAKDAGVDVTWMSGDGSVSSTFINTAGDAANGVYLSIPSDLTGAADFLRKYGQSYGEKYTTVPIYAAEYYDVTSVLGEGVKQAIDGGAKDPTSIRTGIKDYLDSLTKDSPFQGVAKPIAFDPQTHELDAPDLDTLLFFYQVKNGKVVGLGNAADVLT